VGTAGPTTEPNLNKEKTTMPNQAFSDVTTDAEQALTSIAANPDLQPIAEKHRPPIEETLKTIKTLKTLQKTLTADKQTVTQDLQAALKRLKEQLIFLRAAIRGDMGPRTEKLVEYGITPLRKPGRKAKPAGEGESKKRGSTSEPEKLA
jgi:hypothetical protein